MIRSNRRNHPFVAVTWKGRSYATPFYKARTVWYWSGFEYRAADPGP